MLQVKQKDALVQEIRVNEICQVNLMGNIQISTQAVQDLCQEGIPVCYFSMGGWFYGITTGMCTKNVFLRQRQFAMAEQPWFCKRLARGLVAGKIRNQRTLLLRNHVEPDAVTLGEAGGSLPLLARILGHADLSLMRYVHPSQADMDRAMEWYSNMQTPGPGLEKMLLEYKDGHERAEGVARASFWAN